MFEQTTATYDQPHRNFFNTSNEARQVWALDRTRDQIVYLPDNAVNDSVRDACRHGRLRCPIAHCPDPRLIAKGGAQRRHHFAHKVAHTRHDSAAVFCTEAIAMLAAWARRYRGAQLTTRQDGTLGILTIRSATSGNSAEIAVTYNPSHQPTPTDARRQLLVGHTRALLLPRGKHPQLPDAWNCGDPRLVGRLIDEHGAALAVNPQRQLVATILTTRTAERAGLAPKHGGGHPTICLIDHINACRLDAHGNITTPALRALRAWEQHHGPVTSRQTPRRTRRTRVRSTPPPSPALVDDLPLAPTEHPRHSHADINRTVLSGQLCQHDDKHWVLRVAQGRTGRSEILVKLPPGWAPPPNDGDTIVVLGRLTTSPADSRIALVADTLQSYTPRPAPTSGAS